jgi:hypothetical protein
MEIIPIILLILALMGFQEFPKNPYKIIKSGRFVTIQDNQTNQKKQ